MTFNFQNLDSVTRTTMLEEVEDDLKHNKLYKSSRLNEMGNAEYANLLKGAIKAGNEVTLTESLTKDFFKETEERTRALKKFSARVPQNANEIFAEGEFNRFYIRALCVIAISKGQKFVNVYRAKDTANHRIESEAKIGENVDAKELLTDLRTSIGVDTALKLPSGPNSGLSVRLI